MCGEERKRGFFGEASALKRKKCKREERGEETRLVMMLDERKKKRVSAFPKHEQRMARA